MELHRFVTKPDLQGWRQRPAQQQDEDDGTMLQLQNYILWWLAEQLGASSVISFVNEYLNPGRFLGLE